MNFRTTAVLLVCLGVLGALYALSRGTGAVVNPGGEGAGEALVLGELVGVKVRVGVGGDGDEGGREYELQRREGGWFQTSPVWFPLTRESGQRWVWAAQDLRVQERLDMEAADAPSLAALSLEPATATVELITDEGAHRFELGDQTVAGPGYLLTDAGDVVVVGSALHELVYLQNPKAWYGRELPTPGLSRLQTVVLQRGKETIRLHRVPEGWSLDAARRQRVEPALLAALEELLAGASAVEVIERGDGPGDGKRFGLTSPRAVLTLHGAGDDVYRLALGRSAAVDGGGVFVEVVRNDVPGPVLVLEREAVAALTWPMARLRDRRVFEASMEKLVAVRVELPGVGSAEVSDDGAGLALTEESSAAAGVLVDGTTAAALARAVLGLRAAEFVTGFRTEDAPAAVITVRWGVTREVKAAVFRDGDRWVAKRSDEAEVFVLDGASVSALPFSLGGEAGG